jgi:hypothetical protein
LRGLDRGACFLPALLLRIFGIVTPNSSDTARSRVARHFAAGLFALRFCGGGFTG